MEMDGKLETENCFPFTPRVSLCVVFKVFGKIWNEIISLSRMSATRLSVFIWSQSLLLLLPFSASCAQYSKEVCQNEHFQAACPSGHVILMTSVFYGRMNFGKCVKTNFGYVGCYNDVIGQVHRRCSGRQTCTIRIPDSVMDRTKPCNDDLKSYLEANYTCIKITTKGQEIHPFPNSDSPCSLQLDESNPQIYLLHSHSQKQPQQQQQQQQQSSSKGRSPCSLTWLVNARSGQRISIELYDLSPLPSLLPVNTTQSKSSQNSASRRSSNGKLLQQSDKQAPVDLNPYPLVAYQSISKLEVPVQRTAMEPKNNSNNNHPHHQRHQHHRQQQLQQQISSAEFLQQQQQQQPFSHCLISVVNVHDLVNVTANVETFESAPSYTLCGSDLSALDSEMRSLLRERTTKMRALETWLQAYETRGSSVRLELIRSQLPESVYLLKLEATGCPTMDTFADDVSVTQYDVSTLRVECKKNGRAVHLLCNGTRWNGTVNSCDSIDTAFSTQMETSGVFSFGTMTLAGLILIWSVAMGILFFGLCYFRRKRLRKLKQGLDIGLKDLRPLNSQDAMYDITNQDIYAKNQAFETTTTTAGSKNQLVTPSSPDPKRSPTKPNSSSSSSSSSSTLPPSTHPSSAVAVLLPSKKTNSLLPSKTRPAAVEFCTRVWQSPEASRRNKELCPKAPIMTFHPTVSRRQNNFPEQLQMVAPCHHRHHPQQQQQLSLSDDFSGHPDHQMSYSPHVRQPPQMVGLRAVWIDNGDCCSGYQNSIVNQTYSLPDKSRKIRTSKVVVLSQCNEYENEDDRDGYVQQRRLPLPPTPNAPLLTLAFRNATYNSWNSNSLPVQNGTHHFGPAGVDYGGDVN